MESRTAAPDWEALAQTIADGFQSLLRQVDALSKRERDLDSRLNYAYKEYMKLASDTSLSHSDTIGQEAVAQRMLHGADDCDTPSSNSFPIRLPNSLQGDEQIHNGFQAYKTIKTNVTAPYPRRIKDTALQIDKPEEFEQDFTTPGIEGNLECPFTRMIQPNGVPTPPLEVSETDPIKVEFHREMTSTSSAGPPPSASAAAGKCPIRYLDQHSPEEVAKYFENHKHEIPRSHEICVKRYQQNSESIRELDSKYGNLVSMIQGLGVKHQQYLPSKDGRSGNEHVSIETDAVSRWADEVSHREKDIISAHGEEEADDNREGHFQRPLREIRVGESPSRPWGIPVPAAPDHDQSILPSPEDVLKTGSPSRLLDADEKRSGMIGKEQPSLGKCPVDHTNFQRSDPVTRPQKSSQKSSQPNPTNSTPQMVFHGPVFFGYAPEQTMEMMKQMSADFMDSK